jgi:DNA-binding transcriptional ArsR family regulator
MMPSADDASPRDVRTGGQPVSLALSEPFLELVARRLQAVAEPNRLRILKLLEQNEATVQGLTDELATTKQNVSKHLGILYQSGIVSRRKDGTKVWYTLADFTTCHLIEQAAASTRGYVEELATTASLDGYT